MENTWGKYFQFKLLGRQHTLKEKISIISFRSMIKCLECVPRGCFQHMKTLSRWLPFLRSETKPGQIKHWSVVFGILSHPLAPKSSVVLVAQPHCSSHGPLTGEAPASLYSFQNLAWWYAPKSCSDGCFMKTCLQRTENRPPCISFLPWERVPWLWYPC